MQIINVENINNVEKLTQIDPLHIEFLRNPEEYFATSK